MGSTTTQVAKIRSAKLRLAAAAVIAGSATLAARPQSGRAQVFAPASGSASWNSAANWSTGAVPNAAGASATFNGAATANNPAQTGNRTITLDAAITVGSLTLNTDTGAFTNSIQVGTSGSLTFNGGASPSTISVPAAPNGTGNTTISAPMTLATSVVATVDNVTASSAAGALNLTNAIGGAGGFTKLGDGLATFGTGAKTYTGATVLGGGRTRISLAAEPANTSSFTINVGGQLDLIAGGTFAFGAGPLNLNGTGPSGGPQAVFPGAIRPDRALVLTINNPVVLQSNTVLHMEATAGTGNTPSPTGSMTLAGSISGPGKLTFTAPGSDVDQGTLALAAANTYTGGTLVQGGILSIAGPATLGTGNVTVDNSASPSSIARLSIASGTTNAIADTATLSLAGGGRPGVADQNYVILGDSVNESVGGLILGGVPQLVAGTYGATGSGATFTNDEYFSGPGVITLSPVPEPSALGLLAAGGVGLLPRRRRDGAG